MSRYAPPILALIAAILLLAACDDGQSTSPYTGYLEEEIPPCTPVEGSALDPCEPDVYWLADGVLTPNFLPMRSFLEPFSPSTAWVSSIVLRGTYLPGTVRCNVSDARFRWPPDDNTNDESEWIHATATRCYVGVRVNSYVLGSGPPILTVLVDESSYSYSPAEISEEERQEHARGSRIYNERRFVEGGYFSSAAGIAPGGIEGAEVILFIGPWYDASAEAWELFNAVETWEEFITWDVERQEDGSVIAVHPLRDLWRAYSDDYRTYRSQLGMELPAFRRAVTEAHQERVTEYSGRIGADEDLPLLITDANQLSQFYRDTGAYNHQGGPPAQPPPPCGLVVSNQLDNPGLMTDCFALLAAKDTLRGTATLNWGLDTTIANWNGVTVEGTPQRVTKLVLTNKSLTGSIPPELGQLSGLDEIRLARNSLTGCIPIALENAPTNDLASLNLPYCEPSPSQG